MSPKAEVKSEPLQGLCMQFGALSDPRIERTKLHQLMDIITIAVCAVICGADDWVEFVSKFTPISQDRRVWSPAGHGSRWLPD